MCCSGGQVAQTDQQLQTAMAASVATQTAEANAAFANQSSTLGNVTAFLNYMKSNPMGYTPEELHAQTTSINDQTAMAAKQAIGAAAARGAQTGAADVGGGGTAAITGQILSGAAQAKAGELQQQSMANQELKRQNLMTAVQGLNQVGAEYGGQNATALGASSNETGAAINAGQGVESAKYAGEEAFGGMLSGIAGLGQAGASAYGDFLKQCWVASAIYGGWFEPRTVLVRNYLFGEFSETWYGHLLMRLYSKFGERLSKRPWIVRMLTPLFNIALHRAQERA